MLKNKVSSRFTAISLNRLGSELFYHHSYAYVCPLENNLNIFNKFILFDINDNYYVIIKELTRTFGINKQTPVPSSDVDSYPRVRQSDRHETACYVIVTTNKSMLLYQFCVILLMRLNYGDFVFSLPLTTW